MGPLATIYTEMVLIYSKLVNSSLDGSLLGYSSLLKRLGGSTGKLIDAPREGCYLSTGVNLVIGDDSYEEYIAYIIEDKGV